MSPRPDLSMPLHAILDLLDEPLTGVLSTLGPGGFPHSVGIYYVPVRDPKLELHMWVYGKSQKAANVRRDPRSALLVERGEPYIDLKGVLARGRARIESDPSAVFDLGVKVYERYFLPRTGIDLDDGPRANIERQAQKRVNLVLSPTTLSSWDHARGQDTISGGNR